MQYKNISDQELVIPNIGVVMPGATIEAKEELHNPNLQKVESDRVISEEK